ncbi:MAG TPA: hypothetical protein VGB91_15940 [Rhizomicrobium sp.]
MIIVAVLVVVGVGGLAACAIALMLAWRKTAGQFGRFPFIPTERLIWLIALGIALSCCSLAGAWYLGGRPPAPACTNTAREADAYCAKLDTALARLEQIEAEMRALKRAPGGPSGQTVTIAKGAPSASLGRADWEAITDHAIDKAVASRMVRPPATPAIGLGPLLLIGALFALGLVLWFWPQESPLARKLATISLLIGLATSVMALAKQAGDAGASLMWLFGRTDSKAASTVIAYPWPYLVETTYVAGLRLPAIPIFFEQNATRATVLRQTDDGLKIGPMEKNVLSRLVGGLKICSVPGRRVALRVVGFASSAEFQGVEPPMSELENMDIANLRAKQVADALRGLGGTDAQFEIDDPGWASFPKMRDSRPYDDSTDDKTGDLGQQMLDRVVFVELVNAGRCAIR